MNIRFGHFFLPNATIDKKAFFYPDMLHYPININHINGQIFIVKKMQDNLEAADSVSLSTVRNHDASTPKGYIPLTFDKIDRNPYLQENLDADLEEYKTAAFSKNKPLLDTIYDKWRFLFNGFENQNFPERKS